MSQDCPTSLMPTPVDGYSGSRGGLTDVGGAHDDDLCKGREAWSYLGWAVDKVRYYNRAVTQAEVTRLYVLFP